MEKIPTGIPGFDELADGGLPKGRTCLLTGTSGSGKTVFAAQFLAAGIEHQQEPGVFVTFEERPEEIRANLEGFGWPVRAWEEEGLWRFVDVSPDPSEQVVVAGAYNLDVLVTRLQHAISDIDARRVSLDSLGSIFGQVSDPAIVRRMVHRLTRALREEQITAVLTSERLEEYGSVSRHGVEEFVSDGVILLRNALKSLRRRRTIEILKLRGTTHSKGEYPFTIQPDRGIETVPLSAMQLHHDSLGQRRPSGVEEVDEMIGGGFFNDSVVLISGATGTGKTMLVTEFLRGGAVQGERCLLFAFEEGGDQIRRNAAGWGIDLRELEDEGSMRIEAVFPEVKGLEDHLIWMQRTIDAFEPDRVAIDSLSALERISDEQGFREFVVSLVAYLKEHGVMAFVTSTTPTLVGGTSVTEAHISTITDAILLLRYVELYGRMHRGFAVLKMRGSDHDKRIREFEISDEGLKIGNPFHRVIGVLSGNINYIAGKVDPHHEEQVRADDERRSLGEFPVNSE